MKQRVLLLSLASLLFALPARTEVVERVVAKVNGDIITLSELQVRQLAAVQAARVEPARVAGYLRENNAKILQAAIDDVLLLQKADQAGLKLREEYLDQIVEGIKKDNKIANDEEFQAQLTKEGLTLEQLKRDIAHQMMRRQILTRDLEPKTVVSDAEARAEYEAHKAEYVKPATVTLDEILVGKDDRTGGQALATQLAAQARAGADFAELAKSYSRAPTAAAGGRLGTFAEGELSRELDKLVFSLPPGGISDPTQTANGYRLLKVSARTDGHVVPFEEVREEIVGRLREARGGKVWEEYIAELRKNAIIDVRVREVPLQVTLPGVKASRPDGRALQVPEAEALPLPETATPAGAAPASAPGEQDEFVTTPQARPERVVPGAAPPPQ
jgi:peptidyl-prolyl cis-trans isomerase SurA